MMWATSRRCEFVASAVPYTLLQEHLFLVSPSRQRDCLLSRDPTESTILMP